MAVPSNTFKTFEAIGKAESFDDLIYNISPTDVPYGSALKRQKIDNTHHEWQTDALATAANNKHLEGDDSAAEAQTPTVIRDNYTQIMKKVIQVSGTNQTVRKHGRSKDELAYLVAKAGEELTRDVEFALTQNTTYNAGAAGIERQLRGLEGWIETNDVHGTSGSSGSTVPATNTGPTDGTQRAFTEAQIRAVQKLCREQGGKPGVLMVGPHNRGVVDGFTGFQTRMGDAASKGIVATIEFYQGPFGKLKVVDNLFQRDRTAFLLDMDYWRLGVLRPIKKEELAKTGDSTKYHLVCEYTLISRNEKASGAVRDLTTS